MNKIEIGTLLGLITALAAAIAAFASWKTAKETKSLVLAEIINDIRNQFNSPEILECKLFLLENMPTHDLSTMSRIIITTQEVYQGQDQRIKKLSEYIRKYYNLFHKITIFGDTRYISKKILRKVILPDELDVLFNVIEPLVKDNSDYDPLIFKKYRTIFKYEVIQ